MSAPLDPNAPARPESGLFGLPSSAEEAGVHVIGVPFEATTSYRRGTARAPEAILKASHQVELYDLEIGRTYEAGIWMAPIEPRIVEWNADASACAARVIERGGYIGNSVELSGDRDIVDRVQQELNEWLHARVRSGLENGKLVATLGGDHSVSFGAIQAHAEKHPGLGILHFDAHADLRDSYEGFAWSHASIFHNVIAHLDGVSKLVQIGLRDVCEEEVEAIRASNGRIQALFDHEWARARMGAEPPLHVIRRTLDALPQEVYVSFDVDGLIPTLCPNTGTPVPGGLRWEEAMLWLTELVASGKQIIGFDLTEVAPGKDHPPGSGWDEIVGARLLYRLIGCTLKSQGRV